MHNLSTDYIITLLGYTNSRHTNWYPWLKFKEVFEALGYECDWTELANLDRSNGKRRLFICWNEPDSATLVQSAGYQKTDIILQKLTSFGIHDGQQNWTDDPLTFFRDWKWPLYQMVERLCEEGHNIYAFGCKTRSDDFPEKKRIVDKLGQRLFWIPWGSSVYTKTEIDAATPVMSNFKYDIGWVGSIWGKVGRGNIDSWQSYVEPLMLDVKNDVMIAGMGTKIGPVTNSEHKAILEHSRLCPILNAPSWRVENGVQDRFWTVFTTGRFGVVDVEGILDFFDESEVVFETDPPEYVIKSNYYLNNVEKQRPYIEKILSRIKSEYNYYSTWGNIFENINKQEASIEAQVFRISLMNRERADDRPSFLPEIAVDTLPDIKISEDKTAYLIGNGPSLNQMDMSRLKGKDTISFNRAYIAYEDWGFDPKYFMVIDYRVLNSITNDLNKLIESSSIEHFFIRDIHGYEPWNEIKYSTRDKVKKDETVSFFRTFDEPKQFSKDISFERLTYWGDVSVCALQILYLLGYEKVYLLGCDCNYQENNIEGVTVKGGEYISSKNEDVNHFRSDYFGKGQVYSKPHGKAHFNSWKKFAQGSKSVPNFDVYSVSPVSTLNDVVWPYISFDEATK